jgi:steroid delta-isomerase-like uncharacterized protein
MSIAANKTVVRRLLEEIWNRGDFSHADELLADDIVNHSAISGVPPGREGVRQLVTLLRTAVPDLQLVIEDLIADEDRVVVRVTARGTHQGAVGGTPATGRHMTWTGIHIYRLAGGTVVERWGEASFYDLLQHLGEIPALGPVSDA